MNSRALYRVRDIKASIVHIRSLLAGKSFDEMYSNAVVRAAFERFLEILSEASRSVPAEWKTQFGPAVPWRQIADLGNFLRHQYHRTDAQMLWAIYESDLDVLEDAIDAILAEYGRP